LSLPAAATLDTASGAAPAAAAVLLEGLTKRYGDVRAVDDLDLEIRRGEFFTMLGPSGSGKTTTLRLIGGFERPDAGRIMLGGTDVASRPPYERDVNTPSRLGVGRDFARRSCGRASRPPPIEPRVG
jgi:ABC-type branched-subunit amino acid transport system ATPase component